MPKTNRVRLRVEYDIPCQCGEILHYAPEVLCSLRVQINQENTVHCEFWVLEDWDGAGICPKCGEEQTLELRPYEVDEEVA